MRRPTGWGAGKTIGEQGIMRVSHRMRVDSAVDGQMAARKRIGLSVLRASGLALALFAASAWATDLTSPANGSTYAPPATIQLSATAESDFENGIRITKVEFYANGTLLTTDTSMPYQYTWSSVSTGSYSVYAVAYDQNGNQDASLASQVSVTAPTNQKPTVSVTSPANGAVVPAGTPVTVSATASDSDGTITLVEFYDRGYLIGSDSTSPYSISWPPGPYGPYSITAKAYDNGSAATESAPVGFRINYPPYNVQVISPGPNTVYQAPATITIDAKGFDDDGINRVEFYNGATLLATDTTNPYSYSWPNVPAGSYNLSARVYDQLGAMTTAASVPVIVNQAPTVSLTAPASGSVILAPGSVWVRASASDADDGVSKVEFYRNGSLISTDTAAPFEVQWTGLAAATYTLSAKAYDTRGGVTSTANASLIVNAVPTVSLTAPANGTIVNGPTSYTLAANAADSDGSISKVEFYSGATLLATDTSAPYSFTWSNINPGSFSITAKATDDRGAVVTTAASSFIVNAVPAVTISAPANGAVVTAPANVQVTASASDADDGLAMVEFYSNGTKIATDTAAPFVLQWNNVPAGTYSLTAKAYDNRGGATTSAASSLIVNTLPSVTLTSPASGTTINAPNSYTLSANASDSDGTITQVEFYSGTTLLATDTTAPYSYVWSNIPAGTYSITAKAIDNRGGAQTSTASTLILNAPPTISISSPASGAVVVAPASVLIQTNASDSDDAVAIVEFYVNGQHVATDTAAPFTLQADNMPAGTYTLAAKAYDGRGGATMSAPVTLIVNERPQVQLVSPANNAGIVIPKTITLAATASDSDGSINKVEFYNGTTLLGTVTSAPYQLSWTVSGAGDYSLTARAYDNRGTANTSPPSLLRARLEGFELIQDGVITGLSGELPTHDPSVGALGGTPGVSGGAATYAIPFVIPPGRRGMMPQLALSYSSRASNGIAGVGWSLSGLSAIQRCPATLDQDGQVRAVRLDAYDRLCLDGQRLLVKSGTYGQAGSTYGTEVESFVRVTLSGGGLDSASSYFKVERKSGEISYYGSGVSGRVIPGGKSVPLTWLVNRTEDRLGNFIEYRYATFAEGEVLLSSILYTGFGNTVGDRKVEFIYESRPEVEHSSSYLAGGLTRQTQRLRFVRTYVGLEAVREYRLRYDLASSHTGRSLLRGVAECAYQGGNAVCRPETTFAWQEAAGTHPFKSLSIANLPNSDNLLSIKEAGDLDGDGIQELYLKYKTTANPVGPSAGYYIAMDADRQVRGSIAIEDVFGVDARTYAMGRHTNVDFNKDGRTDILNAKVVGSTTEFTVAVWNGSTQWLASGFSTYSLGVFASDSGFPEVADFNGDGYTDLLVMEGETYSPHQLKIYLGKRSSVPGQPAINTTAAVNVAVPGSTIVDSNGIQRYASYGVERIEDFDGDGLPDVFLTRDSGRSEHDKPQLLWFSRVGSSGQYSLAGPGNEIATLAALASPQLEQDETHQSAMQQWLDVNGDGLTDFVSAKRLADGNGYWTLRLNQGGYLGPRIVTNSRRGLERCINTTSSYLSATCGDRWRPMFQPQFSIGDTNTDGSAEMLVPRGFAARVCGVRSVDAPNGEDNTDYYCPEHPVTGDRGPYPSDFIPTEDHMKAVYAEGGLGIFQGRFDASAYYMDSVRFVQTGATSFRVDIVNTPIVQGGDKASFDLYGDGLQDQVSFLGCPWKPIAAGGDTWCHAFVWSADPAWGPGSLPNGAGGVSTLAGSRKPFISENTGAGARNGLPSLLPDFLAQTTDGLGNQTLWDYAPLSSKAGRGTADTPLYSLPASPASRYADDRHVYFASSMPVVSEMIRSNGIGGYRSWRYGYTEAMYHMRGRGFQGFRSIIEEDEEAGLRTTSTFHQKFPLTSQLESVVVNPIVRPGTTAPIKREDYAWRCNRADRSDTSACATATGGTTVFSFVDSKETWTFDATIAADPSGGTPPAIGYVQEVNADDATCSGSFASSSGFDAYGNLTVRTVHASDVDSGTGGLRAFVDDQCQREQNSYTVDTGSWWLDRLDQKTVTTSVTWDAARHPLPANTANPSQTIVTQYTWNADRTPATEVVQPGVANQQRATAYAYPSGSNYGLPTGIGISADGDPNGTRSSGTAYSADGYFPRVITNALNHTAITEVRARDGQPYLSTDANGLRTFAQYDAFGMLIRNQYRGRTDAEYLVPDKNIAISACNGTCGGLAVYAMTEVQDGAPTKVSYLDAFGRAVRATTRLADGALTQVSTAYNSLGRVTQSSEPYKTSETPSWTVFTYDLLGRVTSKLAPQANHDGRGDRATTYTYSGRETQIRVCGTADSNTGNCLTLSRTTDSLGRYVETLDAKGGRTRFWYNPSGSALALEDAKGTVIRAGYNAMGHRTLVDDPNQGVWTFAYDALGELKQQTDARQVTTSFAYDKLGRPTSRTASVDATGDGVADAVADSWTYDPSNALGQPASTQRTINGAVERTNLLGYDALVRPVQTDVTQALVSGTQDYRLRQRYDAYYGRVIGQEFPNGEAVEVLYSAYGHLLGERDPGTGVEYRATTAIDARGNVVGERFADGNITDARQYVEQTGQLAMVQYSNFGGGSLRKLEYRYDVYGNVINQSLNAGSSTESYRYDELHRLVEATRSGAASGSTTYGYDAAGNFTFKSDFSTTVANAYSYTGGSCGGGPNAVKAVQTASGTRSYCFDSNGNLTADSVGLSVKYDHQNLPVVVQRGALRDDFRYGPDGQRTRSWGSDGARVYLPGYEHRTDTGETKVYIADYAVISRSGGTRKVEYLLKDRLGSVDAVANASGTVTETRGYDAFGKPRSGIWADVSPAKLQSTATTPKGFTQHEHLNQLELIHMNGRVFDYNLGRFTGVDPFIQAPLNSQSLNPYSYILNNPLSGTDPTGYVSQGLCTANPGPCPQEAPEGSDGKREPREGGVQRFVNKALGAWINGGIDHFHAKKAENGAKGQGATGGETLANRNALMTQKGASASNANGAVGDSATSLRKVDVVGSGGGGGPSSGGNALDAEKFLQAESSKSGDLFCRLNCSKTADLAHEAAANRYLGASIASRREVGWLVYELPDGSFSFTYPRLGDVGIGETKLPEGLKGWSIDSAGHTHWDSNHQFSPQDWRVMTQDERRGPGMPLYVATGDGNLSFGSVRYARSLAITRGAAFMPPYGNFPGERSVASGLRTTFP